MIMKAETSDVLLILITLIHNQFNNRMKIIKYDNVVNLLAKLCMIIFVLFI